MARKISHEDSRAIDLLLDRAPSGRGGPVEVMAGSIHVKSGKSNIRHRLEAAERVFKLLDQMPAVEPPADLVQRTLAQAWKSRRWRFIPEADRNRSRLPALCDRMRKRIARSRSVRRITDR